MTVANVFNLPLWGIPILIFSIPNSWALSTVDSSPEIKASHPSIPNLLTVENLETKKEFKASFLTILYKAFNLSSLEIYPKVKFSILSYNHFLFYSFSMWKYSHPISPQ